MKIPFLNLKYLNKPYENEIKIAVNRVVESGWYLLGNEVRQFEEEFSSYIDVNHVVGVANGLDALRIILHAYIEMGVMNDGDEVNLHNTMPKVSSHYQTTQSNHTIKPGSICAQ